MGEKYEAPVLQVLDLEEEVIFTSLGIPVIQSTTLSTSVVPVIPSVSHTPAPTTEEATTMAVVPTTSPVPYPT